MPDVTLDQINEKVVKIAAQFDEVRTKIVDEAGTKAKELADTAVADVASDLLEKQARLKDELVPALLERQKAELKADAEKSNEALLARMDEVITKVDMAASGGVSVGESADARAVREGFRDYIRLGKLDSEAVRDANAAAKRLMEQANIQHRDLSEGTDTEGGFLVPEPLREEMIKIITVIDPIEALARRITLRGNSYKAPKRTGIPTAYKASEQSTGTDSPPTFGSVDRTLHPIDVLTSGISPDFLQDVVEADQVITEAAAEALGYKLGYNYILGTGVGEAEGIFTNASIATVTGTDVADHKISGEDFFQLLTTLKEYYRPNATFIFNSTVLYNALSLRSLRTAVGGGSDAGDFQFPLSMRDGVPATIAGKPFRICESIADDGTINYLSVAFGDFRKGYWIARKAGGGISAIKDPYSNKPNWEYLWRIRDDGVVVNDEAIKILKMG